jgi:hypothetical protein
MDRSVSKECRRVKHAIQAWKTNLPYVSLSTKHMPAGPILPVGEPVLIWPPEEVQVSPTGSF